METMSMKNLEDMHDFERRVYDYTRRWAVNRRDLLKGVGAGGAALAATSLYPGALSAQDGTTLRIARGQVSDTLDPQKTSGLLVAHEIMWQIYDSLIYLHEDGTVYPGLATEWAIAEDGLTVT
jgi:ABC-type transport system substrate-binding protein